MLEGNCYFALEALHWEYFRPSRETTVCSWKGTASYYDIEVAGEINRAAAWYYADPKPGAEKIRNRVAFWKGITVE